jgi:hypothetical protein
METEKDVHRIYIASAFEFSLEESRIPETHNEIEGFEMPKSLIE